MGEAGFARVEMTAHDPGMAMLGWGLPDQRPTGVRAPLFARAMVLRAGDRVRAMAVADLCFISVVLRERVKARLGDAGLAIRDADLMLLATHTHSGPNGYHHALFYDLSGPGLSHAVLEELAAAIARAVVDAHARLEPARLSVGRDRVEAGVAFNRAVAAHRRNEEVVGAPAAHEAVDRTLTLLRADTPSGAPLGAVVAFPLHATSVHGDQRVLHPDHKGLAALAFEDAVAPEARFVALFVQGAAGDVSPNHRFDPRRGLCVGRFDDDFRNAACVAGAEVRAARRAFERAVSLGPTRRSTLRRVDFERRPVPSPFAPPGARTTPARLGVAMARGTREGPGPLAPLGRLLDAARRRGDDPKRTLLEVGPAVRSRLLGRLEPARVPIPHPAFRRVRALAARGGLGAHPWIPTVLPVQLWQLGGLALLALPNEPTTIAGRRLAAAVTDRLGGADTLVLGYANAYSGYLTTAEEYAEQGYEGAYTLFGPHTLGAYLDIAADLTDAPDGRDAGPSIPRLTPDEEQARRV